MQIPSNAFIAKAAQHITTVQIQFLFTFKSNICFPTLIIKIICFASINASSVMYGIVIFVRINGHIAYDFTFAIIKNIIHNHL